jgi:hypothetical protein
MPSTDSSSDKTTKLWERVAAQVAIATAALYLVGFTIVTPHFAYFARRPPEVLEARFFAAALLFLWMSSVPIVVLEHFRKTWQSHAQHRLRVVLNSFLRATVGVLFTWLILWWLGVRGTEAIEGVPDITALFMILGWFGATGALFWLIRWLWQAKVTGIGSWAVLCPALTLGFFLAAGFFTLLYGRVTLGYAGGTFNLVEIALRTESSFPEPLLATLRPGKSFIQGAEGKPRAILLADRDDDFTYLVVATPDEYFAVHLPNDQLAGLRFPGESEIRNFPIYLQASLFHPIDLKWLLRRYDEEEIQPSIDSQQHSLHKQR